MPTQLLTTKLYIPPVRPGLVSRPRLIERLNAGLRSGRKLTLISAPAGFGKTTLLSEWVGQILDIGDWRLDSGETSPSPISNLQSQVSWVSLDKGDNDLVRFLAYFVAALQISNIQSPNIGARVLSAFQAPQPPPVESVLTALINEMAAVLPGDCLSVLVLDDYHVITAQLIHSALTFLLDHLPPQMHLVIATRVDPPLPIARLRGRGQLTELRQNDLRFTPNEVTEFLDRAMGIKLTADDVAALTSRTEGWIAGLQMAAVSMQEREDTTGFVRAFTGSNRYILDYLIEEVLQHQPEGLRTFLLQTAILDRLTGPLCDAVVGEIGDWRSQAILEYLESSNLFIVPLDSERRWYRYHHLFADLLRKRLRQAHPDLVPALHGRASLWYEQNGLVAAAIDHALAAKDFYRAAHLIDALAETLWGRGEQTTLSTWLAALPDELVTSRPHLCACHAMVLLMAGQPDAAERRLQGAERLLGSTTAEAAVEQRGMVAAVRALSAYFRGDGPAIIRFSRRALEMLPEGNAMWRGGAAVNLGDAYRWSGDLAAASRAYAEAMKAGQTTGNTFLVMLVGIKQAFVQMHQGRLQRALEICRQQLELLDKSGLADTPMAAGVYAVWGNILCEWNDLDKASSYVQKACELCARGHSVGLLGLSYLTLLRILCARRDVAGAAETLYKLERLARESNVPVWISSGAVAWRAWLWVTQGKLDAAAQLLRERGLSVDGDVIYPREAERLSLARLLIAQGKFEEATRSLERSFQEAEAGEQVPWVITTSNLRALALHAQGDVEPALASLERALSLAEPEGYVRAFLDEGPAMAELLSKFLEVQRKGRRAVSRGTAPGYVSRLLAAFDVSEHRTGPRGKTSSDTRAQPLIDPLSERELEVLHLLARGLSNPEIAQELVVARSTVRSHVKSIYSKLSVHKRWDAVQRARDLGLL
jgi:LuxR family maltose regulon positive regulatory protein